MPATRELQLAIPSELSHVRLVGAVAKAVAAALGLASPEPEQIELCVVEAVTNAIRHAYRGDPGSEVAVRFRLGPGALRIDVTDHGESIPMERRQAPPPLPEAGELLLVEGGQGLRLIHELMDEVTYRTSADRNTLTMVRRLESATRPG